MTEWFKVTDCKSVRDFPYHRFESYFFQYILIFKNSKYDAAVVVPVLGTGSHVFKSHYFETFLVLNY